MSTDAAGIVADIDAAMLAAVPSYDSPHRPAIRDGLFAAIAEGIVGYEGEDEGGGGDGLSQAQVLARVSMGF